MVDHDGDTASRERLTRPEFTRESRQITDFTLDERISLLEFRSPAENASNYTAPRVDLSSLDTLPLEILQMVLSYLDVRSLTNLRRVNRRALDLVESILTYKTIVKHVHYALRAALVIGTASNFTCGTLYTALRQRHCQLCGDCADYLYLLTCERVCFLCFTEHDRYLPLRRNHALLQYGLDRGSLKELPQMRGIPGVYSPNEKKVASWITLLDRSRAYDAGIGIHGTANAMDAFMLRRLSLGPHAHDKRILQRLRDPLNQHNSGPLGRKLMEPDDGRSGNPFRFMAVVRIPSLETASQRLRWGFYCVGCDRSARLPCHRRRKFTNESFQEHLEQCGSIQKGTHQNTAA